MKGQTQKVEKQDKAKKPKGTVFCFESEIKDFSRPRLQALVVQPPHCQCREGLRKEALPQQQLCLIAKQRPSRIKSARIPHLISCKMFSTHLLLSCFCLQIEHPFVMYHPSENESSFLFHGDTVEIFSKRLRCFSCVVLRVFLYASTVVVPNCYCASSGHTCTQNLKKTNRFLRHSKA